MHAIVEKIVAQDVRALARGITMIENNAPNKLEMLHDVFSSSRHAHYIGITGSPGAGKSSLVNRLISTIREEEKTVAVIAVDPTSPFSGGALLGDRIRMNEHFTDDGVFIRSMATRGSLGGLARATKDSIRLCDAFGFDVIIVETVGVGQSELDIMKVVDTTAVVLTPNSGDVLQIFKAGIMEIADLFVINKADLPGFGKLKALVKELVMMLPENEMETAIIKTIATKNKGIDKLWDHLKKHHAYLEKSAEGKMRKKEQKTLEVYELIREEIWRDVKAFIEKMDTLTIDADSDPYQLASDLYVKWKDGRGESG
ncbi:MAG TPA: methylmalonyl Co-A mutase-associated GTPase MeaB [Bacillota bacterium]|nr:methylmalonyl Co-A mutase-associated GTPase MeaB [Bacillota bacterium]